MSDVQEIESVETDDLDAAIMEAMEEAEAAEAPVEEVSEETVEETAEEVTEEAEEPEDTPETAETEESDEETQEEEEEELLEPLHHFSADEKSMFSQLDNTGRQIYLDRIKNFERGIHEKSQKLAESERQFESVKAAVEPYVQQWQMKGIDPYSGLQRALTIAGKLDADPQRAILELAQQSGVNLESVVQEAPYQDPQDSRLQRLETELREQNERFQQQQTQQQQEQITQMIRDFESEQDASGNLKHPHFAKLFPQIGTYLQMGQAKTLGEAYELAVTYDPAIQEEMRQASKVQNIQAKKSAAEKAKAASKKTDSAETVKSVKENTLDEDILEEIEARLG